MAADTRKLTVNQLQDLLSGMKSAHKSDQDVANRISEVQLSEELTLAARNDLAPLLPGPLSTEQVYILEARSATLPPDPARFPSTPPLDAAAQQALLAKTQAYAASYAQLPQITATRMVARFQDLNTPPPTTGAGLRSAGISTTADPVFETMAMTVHLMKTKTEQIQFENGAGRSTAGKDKTEWGQNGMVASLNEPLSLSTVVQEALSSGSPRFERWQTIDNHPVAVFSFAVDRRKTRFQLLYCCFPNTDTVGTTHIASPPAASPLGGSPIKGNIQNTTQWQDFKASPGYQGELFLNPQSGAVVRLITEAHLKPGDFVQYEAVRTDFEPRTFGSRTSYVPIRAFILTDLLPNGDSKAARVAVRHQYVTEDYKDFKLDHASAVASLPDETLKPQVGNSHEKVIRETNADLLAARAATKEKRYADAESLMLKVTAARPELILPWVELGLAQIGLQKYTEAEASFKTALAIDPKSPKSVHQNGFLSQDNPQTTHATSHATASSAIASEQSRPPEVTGIILSSLGEIYIRTNRPQEAEAAFDDAAKANAAQAASYLREETIYFFQTGNTDAQLRAAEKAIAADASGAAPYYFKAQALVSKATMDNATGKMTLPPGCAEAYQKYLQLDPNGQFSADAKGILTAAGLPIPKKS
jgi:tetratricopeptide (TPR) repeat protein